MLLLTAGAHQPAQQGDLPATPFPALDTPSHAAIKAGWPARTLSHTLSHGIISA